MHIMHGQAVTQSTELTLARLFTLFLRNSLRMTVRHSGDGSKPDLNLGTVC